MMSLLAMGFDVATQNGPSRVAGGCTGTENVFFWGGCRGTLPETHGMSSFSMGVVETSRIMEEVAGDKLVTEWDMIFPLLRWQRGVSILAQKCAFSPPALCQARHP